MPDLTKSTAVDIVSGDAINTLKDPTVNLSMTQRFQMAVDQVTSLLNASTTYGSTNNDDVKRHPPAEISDQVALADAYVVGAFLAIPGHPRRASYITAVNVLYNNIIPAHIGPIGAVLVDGEQAEWLPATEIKTLKIANADNSLLYSGPYYDIVVDRLFFCGGTAATVDICQPPETGTMLQSPPEYIEAVIATALAFLFGKEGADTAAGSFYKSLADSYMEMVRAGAAMIPPVTEYQASRVGT